MISQVGISNGLSWYYTYDNQNHVLTASQYSGGQLVEQETNSYDVFGNMVEQDETSGGNTVVTKFANQVKNTSGVSQVWADLNATNQIQTRRVYLDAVDAVCARIGSNGTEGWYLTDHLGSVGAIMNNNGTAIDHVTYDPWGNPTDSNPSAADRYKFTGQEYDSVTGQYNYRARCYDAAIGRFTSQDPTGFGAGDMDLYRYCGNDPTDRTDPSGLSPSQLTFEVPIYNWLLRCELCRFYVPIVFDLDAGTASFSGPAFCIGCGGWTIKTGAVDFGFGVNFNPEGVWVEKKTVANGGEIDSLNLKYSLTKTLTFGTVFIAKHVIATPVIVPKSGHTIVEPLLPDPLAPYRSHPNPAPTLPWPKPLPNSGSGDPVTGLPSGPWDDFSRHSEWTPPLPPLPELPRMTD